MPKFAYAALDNRGRPAAGEVTAADPRQALARVRELGYFPTELNEITATPAAIRGNKKIRRDDISLTVRQLANLIGAGLPVHRSLLVLTEQAYNPALKQLLGEAEAEVRAGSPLSVALAHYPRAFPPLAINLISIGESTGNLGQALQRLADLLEKTLQRRSQIISALIYPVLLTGVAISAVIFLMTFLLPKLSQTLTGLGTTLPLPTIILIKLSHLILSGWWAGLAVLLGGALAAKYWWKKGLADWLETRLYRIPAIGGLLSRIAAARFARMLGSLLSGGVPILDGMEIAGTGAGSTLAGIIGRAREQVREGVPLAIALSREANILPALVHVTAVGEETGKLADLLLKLAESLDFEVDSSLRRLVGLLEPAIIIVMGLIVGFIVLAILLPIFSLSSAMGG
jgi:type II secretory pathway component PulF